MITKRSLLHWAWLFVGTAMFLYWWENALISIPLSETVWTFYFHLIGQTDLGVASDLEFLTAVAIGAGLSIAAAKLFTRLGKHVA